MMAEQQRARWRLVQGAHEDMGFYTAASRHGFPRRLRHKQPRRNPCSRQGYTANIAPKGMFQCSRQYSSAWMRAAFAPAQPRSARCLLYYAD